MAIIIAAPVIVLFFTGLVILGVYCDNRNKLVWRHVMLCDVACCSVTELMICLLQDSERVPRNTSK